MLARQAMERSELMAAAVAGADQAPAHPATTVVAESIHVEQIQYQSQ